MCFAKPRSLVTELLKDDLGFEEHLRRRAAAAQQENGEVIESEESEDDVGNEVSPPLAMPFHQDLRNWFPDTIDHMNRIQMLNFVFRALQHLPRRIPTRDESHQADDNPSISNDDDGEENSIIFRPAVTLEQYINARRRYIQEEPDCEMYQEFHSIIEWIACIFQDRPDLEEYLTFVNE